MYSIVLGPMGVSCVPQYQSLAEAIEQTREIEKTGSRILSIKLNGDIVLDGQALRDALGPVPKTVFNNFPR